MKVYTVESHVPHEFTEVEGVCSVMPIAIAMLAQLVAARSTRNYSDTYYSITEWYIDGEQVKTLYEDDLATEINEYRKRIGC